MTTPTKPLMEELREMRNHNKKLISDTEYGTGLVEGNNIAIDVFTGMIVKFIEAVKAMKDDAETHIVRLRAEATSGPITQHTRKRFELIQLRVREYHAEIEAYDKVLAMLGAEKETD